jgi:hypothetical protein
MTRRTLKQKENLNTLKTGCAPCLQEAEKIKDKLGKRNPSTIKIEEIKKIVSSLFSDK